MENVNSKETIALIQIGIVFLVAILIIIVYICKYMKFLKKKNLLEVEISRTHGRERRRWERRLRRHYIRQIPFVGKYIARQMKKNRIKRKMKKEQA